MERWVNGKLILNTTIFLSVIYLCANHPLISSPGQFVQVGENPLGNIFYEVMIHVEGIDIGQTPDCVPGHLGKVVVTEV